VHQRNLTTSLAFKLTAFVAFLLLGLNFGTPSFAIDCTKAQTKLEKTICAKPEMIAKDEALNATYTRILSRLSGEERSRLVKSQKNWVADINAKGADNVRYSMAEAFDERIARLASLQSPERSAAQKFAEELRLEHAGEPIWYSAPGRGPLSFKPLPAGETFEGNRPIDYAESNSTWDEGSNRLFAALSNSGMPAKELGELKDFLIGTMGFNIEQTDFTKDGIPDFILHITLGTFLYSSSDYYVGTSAHPPSAQHITSSESRSARESSWVSDDVFIDVNGVPMAVWLTDDGYTFTDFTSNPPMQSHLEIINSSVHDLVGLDDCKIPGCKAFFGDIQPLVAEFRSLDDAIREAREFTSKIEPRDKKWVLAGGRSIEGSTLRRVALRAFQEKMEKDTPSNAKRIPHVTESELHVADIDNDGVPEVYMFYSPPDLSRRTLLYADDSSREWKEDTYLALIDLRKDFKGYDSNLIGWPRLNSSGASWGGVDYFVFEDILGETHIGLFGSEFVTGGSENCCDLELRTIRKDELHLDYAETTRERLKITNVIGFGNQPLAKRAMYVGP
jgi:uncharacterized protein